MAVINTGLVLAGARSEFQHRIDTTKTHFADLSTVIKSDTDVEHHRWLGSLPRVREWGTGRLAKGIRAESFDVANAKYEITIEVDRDELADAKTPAIKIRIGEMAAKAATHKDFLIASLLMNGATAGFVGYDGVTFFNDTHVSGDSGNQDNNLGASATDPDNPSTAEMKEAIKAAVAAIMNFKDDVGDPMSNSSDGIVLVVPTSMYWAALEAVNATIISNTSNVLAGLARVISFPWLTDTDIFYTLKTDGVVRPFIFQDREQLEMMALMEDSDTGFMREVFIFGARARYTMAYGYWQFATKTTFT